MRYRDFAQACRLRRLTCRMVRCTLAMPADVHALIQRYSGTKDIALDDVIAWLRRTTQYTMRNRMSNSRHSVCVECTDRTPMSYVRMGGARLRPSSLRLSYHAHKHAMDSLLSKLSLVKK
jgi:hypothetical protein